MTAEKILAEMIRFGRNGKEIYPFMFQPVMGRSNAVSAAIRLGKKKGVLVQSGVDGHGKPKYSLALPSATHSASASIN